MENYFNSVMDYIIIIYHLFNNIYDSNFYQREEIKIMENTNTALISTETEEISPLAIITGRKMTYCSLEPKTEAEKVMLFNAINSPDKPFREMVNIKIPVQHIFSEVVDLTDKNTGEVIKAVRIVFIDKDGKSYGTVAKGVLNATSKLFASFGTPDTWKKPINILPKLITKDTNQIVSFTVTA
jgi:hypothetical protein